MNVGAPVPLIADGDISGSAGYIDSFSFLLKHHPILYNVEGDLKTWEPPLPSLTEASAAFVRASRHVLAGEELFLPFDLHPQSPGFGLQPFDYVPTSSDYDIADEIIREQLGIFKARNQRLSNKRAQEVGE